MKQRSKTVTVYSIEKNRDGEGGVFWHTRYLPNEGRFPEIGMEKAANQVNIDTQKVEDE